MLGDSACAEGVMNSVWPSGADLATKSVASVAPAPGRFSTMTC